MNRAARAAILAASIVACNGSFRFEDTPDAGGFRPRCATDDDCRLTSLHCDAVSGECVACIDDTHCTRPGEPHCDTSQHRCVQCNQDIDCQGLPSAQRACEPTTRRCLFRCAASEPCPRGAPWCDDSRGFCVRCRSDADCVGSDDGPTCDLAAGHCVTCTADMECPPASPRCEREHGRCVACTSSADCPAPQVCDPWAFACL